MSEYPFSAPPRRTRAPRRRLARAALVLLAIGVAFVLGLAVGKALNDSPRAGNTVTYVRTLEPLPQQPR